MSLSIKQIINIFLFYFIIVLTSCKEKTNKKIETGLKKTTQTENDSSRKRLINFKTFVANLDSNNVSSSSMAAYKFIELFKIKDLTTIDSAYLIFNEFYDKLTKQLNLQHEKDDLNYDSLFIVYDDGKEHPKLSKKIINYQKKLSENGFKIAMDEGITYIKQDRKFITQFFCPFVSNSMKEYLLQINKEIEQGFDTDQGIFLSPNDFGERITWWEGFIDRNPNFILKNKCMEIYKFYFSHLILGKENTPVLNYDTQNISLYFMDLYEYLLKKHAKLKTTELLKPYYFAIIRKNKSEMEQIKRSYKQKNLIEIYAE